MTDISVPAPGNPSGRTITGFALTDSGEAFLGAIYSGGGAPGANGQVPRIVGIFVLDRAAQAWTPLMQRTAGGDPSQFTFLYGAGAGQLVVGASQLLKFYNVAN